MRSCNYCCTVKGISITYSEYVFVALGNQQVMLVRHMVICAASGCTNFFSTLSHKQQDFVK